MDLSLFSSFIKMSHKILIIDDRPKRRDIHLSEDIIQELEALPNVHFSQDAYEYDDEQYDVIAIHTSIVKQNSLYKEMDKLVEKGKYLILFSGGEDQQTIVASGHKAVLSAQVFYSQNLLHFCKSMMEDKQEVQLFELLYGKSWQLPVLIKLRRLHWMDPLGELDYDDLSDIEKVLGIDSEPDEIINNKISELIKLI